MEPNYTRHRGGTETDWKAKAFNNYSATTRTRDAAFIYIHRYNGNLWMEDIYGNVLFELTKEQGLEQGLVYRNVSRGWYSRGSNLATIEQATKLFDLYSTNTLIQLIGEIKDDMPFTEHTSYTGEYKEKSMSDVLIPNYKRRSRRGEIFNNPMERETEGFSLSPQDVNQLGPSYAMSQDVSSTGSVGSGATAKSGWRLKITLVRFTRENLLLPTDELMDHCRSLAPQFFDNPQNAINAAYGNINQSDLQALVVAGEARSTLALVGSAISRITNLVRSVKRGQWQKIAPKTFRKFKRLRSDPSRSRISDADLIAGLAGDAWLEARFGWYPLIKDVEASVALLKGEKSLHPRQTFRGLRESEVDYSSNVTINNSKGDEFAVEYNVTRKCFDSAGVLVETRIENSLANELSLFNVADAAYELTPWSFVADYFINIGGLLYKLRPMGTSKVVASWVTSKCTYTFEGTITGTLSDGTIESIPFRYIKSYKKRTPGTTSTLFTIDVFLDTFRIADLLALLRGVLSKR